MKYKIQNKYITFTIDELFDHKTINDVFDYFHLSRKTIHLLKQYKDYSLNNQFVSSDTLLHRHDHLRILAFKEDDGMYEPTPSSINVVYEDDFLLIVDKPPFLEIYPESQDKHDSLNHYVSYYYYINNYDLPVRPIHRLDKDTSGLVIYCKCFLIQALLDDRLAKKAIDRHYIAIVEGNIKKDGSINKSIGRDRHSNKMRLSDTGKAAITRYRVCSKKINLNMTMLECQLETGRRHQIRVHLASIGHPVVGDKLYGHESQYIKRQALHAYLIELIHPITLEKLRIESELPIDFNFYKK